MKAFNIATCRAPMSKKVTVSYKAKLVLLHDYIFLFISVNIPVYIYITKNLHRCTYMYMQTSNKIKNKMSGILVINRTLECGGEMLQLNWAHFFPIKLQYRIIVHLSVTFKRNVLTWSGISKQCTVYWWSFHKIV